MAKQADNILAQIMRFHEQVPGSELRIRANGFSGLRVELFINGTSMDARILGFDPDIQARILTAALADWKQAQEGTFGAQEESGRRK